MAFKCEGCSKEADKAGLCTEEACKKDKKKVVKTCTSSGEGAHKT